MAAKLKGEQDFESKPDPATWTNLTEKILIELMVNEVRKGNRPITTFTKKGWRNIENGLYDRTKLKYSYSQIRNKFNQLRIRYQDFLNLLKEPGFSFNPICNTLTATDAVWKLHRKANKNMRRFQRTGCPLFNELGVVFREADFQTIKGSFGVEDRVNVEEESTNASPSACPVHTHEKRLAGTTTTDKVPPSENFDGIPHFTGFSITNCVKCLEEIEGLDSDTYLKAIRMFKDGDWREMFMAMSIKRRLDWLTSLN